MGEHTSRDIEVLDDLEHDASDPAVRVLGHAEYPCGACFGTGKAGTCGSRSGPGGTATRWERRCEVHAPKEER